MTRRWVCSSTPGGSRARSARSSAATRSWPASTSPASWRWSSPRRARLPSGCAPAAPASPPSTTPTGAAPWRPAGAPGIPAFYPPPGVGTMVADGGIPIRYDADGNVVVTSEPKETRRFGDRDYVLETALTADFALVRAAVGDRHGNLVFHESARNFNPLAGMAGRITIAEVEELVEPGEIRPEDVRLPGVYVQRVAVVGTEGKKIEIRTTRRRTEAPAPAAAGDETTEA